MGTLGFKAKEEKINDDLDDFNFDDFDFNIEEPKDDRHPALKTISSAAKGVKDYVTDGRNIERFLKQAMPPGYGQAYDKVQNTKSDLSQLYNGIQSELRPAKEATQRALRKLLPKTESKMPKRIQEMLTKVAGEEPSDYRRGGEDPEQKLQTMLTTIFEQKQADKVDGQKAQDDREKVKQGFEQMRHKDDISRLDAIRTSTEALAQYQNNIGYNVQRKQLELSYRQFEALVALNREQAKSNAAIISELKATSKNTGLPDYVKQTMHERFKEIARNKFLETAREGMFGGTADYLKKFTRNLSDQVLGKVRDYSNTLSGGVELASGMGDMAGDMPGMDSKDMIIRMLMTMPMDYASSKLGKYAHDELGKSSVMRRGGARAAHMANTAGDRVHDQLTNYKHNWGGFEFLREMLAGATPSRIADAKMETDSIGKAHEPKPFARSDSKSLTEVIPGLLSRILREIRIFRTGDESTALVSYDFTKNAFSNDKQKISDLRQRIAGHGTDRANKHANDIIKSIDRGGKLTEPQKEKLRTQLIQRSVNGESMDSTKISNQFDWGGGPDGQAIANAFNNYLKIDHEGNLAHNYQSYKRQATIMNSSRAIVGGLGDPRILIQQLVNNGQLEHLKESGIIDANNNLDRKVYAEWLAGKGKPAEEGPAPIPRVNPIPPGPPVPPVNKKGNLKFGPKKPKSGKKPLPIIPIVPKTQSTKKPVPPIVKPGGFKLIRNEPKKPNDPPILPPGIERIIQVPGTQPPEPDDKAPKLNLNPVRESGSDEYNTSNTEAIIKEIKIISEYLMRPTVNASSVEGNVKSIKEIIESLNKNYVENTQSTLELMIASVKHLETIAKRSGKVRIVDNDGTEQDGNDEAGPKQYDNLSEHLKDKIKSFSKDAYETAGTKALRTKRRFNVLVGRSKPKVNSAVYSAKEFAGKKISDIKGQLKDVWGDVIVKGEKFPRIRVSLMEAGEYRDKVTGKVLTTLADIKGDVVDSSGNLVMTLEEFNNSYIAGNVRRKASDIFKDLKSRVLNNYAKAKEAIPLKFQQLKNFFNKAIQKAKDSVPPFDVYVKTDMSKPVLYATLFKMDHYLSKKTGQVIIHPSRIDGEVVDAKGNIVLNIDQIKAGLVDIAGAPVGNELFRYATRALQFAGIGFQALRHGANVAKNALAKGATSFKDYLKDFTVPLSEIITNSKKTVSLLEKIHDLLDERLAGKKVKGDLTGDGIRDGSLEDIRQKREEAKKSKEEKDIKEGERKGSASTNGGIGKLMALLGFGGKKKGSGEDGEDGDEGGGGGLMDMAQGAMGMLGLGGLFGKGKGGGSDGPDRSGADPATRTPRTKAERRAEAIKKLADRKALKAKGAAKEAARLARKQAIERARALATRAASTRAGGAAMGWGARMRGRVARSAINTRVPRTMGRGLWGATRLAGRAGWGATKFGGRVLRGAGRLAVSPGRAGRIIRGGFYNPGLVKGIVRGGVGATRMIGKGIGAVAPHLGKIAGAAGLLYGANEIRKTLTDDTKTGSEKANDVGRTAAGIAGGWAGAKAGAAAGALGGSFVPFVGTAIGGIIGAIGGGMLGYWGATSLGDKLKGLGAWWDKAKLSNLSRLRLAQYGVPVEDKDSMDKVFLLESTLESHITLNPDGNIILDEKAVDMKAIAKDFGVTSPEDIQLFNKWYRNRFVPVYRKWLSVVRKIKPDGKLGNIEDLIPAKDKLTIAEESVNSLTEVFNSTIGWNRAHLKLPINAAGVQQVMDDIRPALQKEAESNGGPKAAAVAKLSTVSNIKDANQLARKAMTDKSMYITKDKDGKVIDASSMDISTLTERIRKGEITVSVGVALPPNLLNNDPSQLDALTTIRFKAYGLTALVADKTRMLGALEDYLADNVEMDKDTPKLTIGADQVLKAAGSIFGVPNGNGEHARRWKSWFNGRFLPVFLLFIGAIRKKTNKKKIKEAMSDFPMVDQGALARSIIGAQGVGSTGGMASIWTMTANPWSGSYEMNTDPDTTAGNLEAIRIVTDKVKLGEVTAKDGKVQETGKANQEKGFWSKAVDKVGSWFGRDPSPKGEGVRATGDTMISKNATPIPGMGDPVSFTGAGGGNFLDLPKPTTAGWSGQKDMIIAAAKMAGVDPKALITTIAVESSFDPNAAPKNPNSPSSAKGLGQHLDDSWREDLQRDGSKFGIPNGTTQFDPRASALMTASRLKFNGNQLAKNLGRPVTTTDLYLAHLMGLGGATKFLKAPSDAIGSEVGGAAAKQHPNYFYDASGKPKTVKQVYEGFTQKLSKRPAELGVEASSMTPSAPAATASTGAAPTVAPVTLSGDKPPATQPSSSGQGSIGNNNTSNTAANRPATASFSNTPAAGTPALNGPVTYDKTKDAVVGKGPAMVIGNGAKYELILQREDSTDDGTYGTLRFPDGTVLNTLELPWRDNAPKISSIAPGTYECKVRGTSNHGESYEVMNVPGRSAVLIHAGNSAGSADKGMKADSQGCILLGMGRAMKGTQKVITASKPAMAMFHEKMGKQPFKLTIRQGQVNTSPVPSQPKVNFTPVREAGTTPDVGAVPKMPTVNVTPAVAPTPNPAVVPIPRMGSTMSSFSPGAPTSREMQMRDQSISDAIGPKLDSISKMMSTLTGTSKSSADSLIEIVKILKAKNTTTEAVASADKAPVPAKVSPVSDTNVPVSMRRKY